MATFKMSTRDSSAAPSAGITAKHRQDRSANELIGIARGILADGSVNLAEATFLLGWLDRHAEFIDAFPFKVLYHRLSDVLTDGVLDLDEERDLLEAMQSVVGGEAAHETGANSLSVGIPFDEPHPKLAYPDCNFVVTGTFSFGKRSAVHAAIRDRGGVVKEVVSKSIHYLIIGEVGARDWKHSSFGTKIEQAMRLRDAGAPVVLIPEWHWAASLSP